MEIFETLSTQWRADSCGPIGLDYGAIEPVLRLTRHPRKQWKETFELLRVMESAALQEMAEQQRARSRGNGGG